MEKQIPLSEWAKRSLWKKTFTGLLYDFLAIMFGVSALVFLMLGLLEPRTTWMIYLGIVLLFLVLVMIFFIIKGRRLAKKEVSEQNLKDWALSEKVRTAIDFLRDNPPNLKKADFSSLQTVDGLKPVRIDYFSQEELAGELTGSFRGTWSGLFVGSMKGEISGNIKGKSTPQLTDQNAVIICTTKKGDSLRLVCPSPLILREKLRLYLRDLANQKYGPGSYTQQALFDFWTEPSALRDILRKLNPERVFDYLITKLELPLEQRPSISVKGVQIKEGSLLVALVSCDGKESEAVIPFDLINEIRVLLEEKLAEALPPVPFVPLLENKGAPQT